MSLSDISIRNSVFAWMLMLGLILFGWISLRELGISEKPDVDFPVVSVHLTYPGAAPEVMETDVVDRVEEAVISVQDIRSISSKSTQETANVTIEFNLDRDIDVALQEVQTKIAQAQRLLPKEMDPPVVTKTNPEDQPIMWVSLSGDRPLREIIEFARDHVKDQLQTVRGVGEVILGGYVAPVIRIWIDPKKLAAYELTVDDVMGALQTEHIEVPAGRIETPVKEFTIRSMGEAKTPEELGNILIRRRGSAAIYKPIYLHDVATVEQGLDEVRRLSRTAGKAAIGLGIKKQRGENAVAVADEVKARLVDIQKTLPSGYSVQVNFDTTQFIKDSTDEMKFNLALAALLTAFVCLAFLASWGATFNILLSIPTSIVGSFIFLYFFGFTLNTFTLLGLTLAIGIVVDDAIMVLENIVRHREMGKSPLLAARDGAREITSAAVATTIAVIAIFIPVIFMKGIIGKFFFQFGITMAVAVALSLLEALTITPMRSSRLLRKSEREGRYARFMHRTFAKLSGRYESILRLCLSHRWKIVLAATGLFAATFLIIPGLKKELVPAQDQSAFIIRAQAPIGSSITFTDEKMKQVEAIISKHPEVRRYYTAVGGFQGGEVDTAMAFISMKPPKERPIDPVTGNRLRQQELMSILRKELAQVSDLKIFMQDLSTRGFTADRGYPVEFSVRGPEWQELTRVAPALIEKMRADPTFIDVDSDYRLGQPEIEILPKRAEAAARGVSMGAIGNVINALVGGVKSGEFTESARRIDIRVRLTESTRQHAANIADLYIRNQFGELVRLGDVADIKERETLKSITRKDRERAVSIFANTGAGYSQDQALRKVETLAAQTLPSGYRIVLGGSAKTYQESFASLLFALYLGIAVAYMVLGSQYNSFIHPWSVLLALPFSICGALLALRGFDMSLNIYSFIGLILLMGIAKKNSILLVDFTNKRREEGLDKTSALLTACPQRLRPILMTSFATIAAAVPPALALGPGAETRQPMAVVIIGGTLVSTLLTLIVVPCAYSLMAALERKI